MLYCSYNTWGDCDVIDSGEIAVTIRTFQPGDEVAQVVIYNEGAGAFPKFKPAIARRGAAHRRPRF